LREKPAVELLVTLMALHRLFWILDAHVICDRFPGQNGHKKRIVPGRLGRRAESRVIPPTSTIKILAKASHPPHQPMINLMPSACTQ
jgi:hypothetical protein